MRAAPSGSSAGAPAEPSRIIAPVSTAWPRPAMRSAKKYALFDDEHRHAVAELIGSL
jgi:hypothetical protein